MTIDEGMTYILLMVGWYNATGILVRCEPLMQKIPGRNAE